MDAVSSRISQCLDEAIGHRLKERSRNIRTGIAVKSHFPTVDTRATSVLTPISRGSQLGTCMACLMYKCECSALVVYTGAEAWSHQSKNDAHRQVAHSLWSTNLHPYLQVSYSLSESRSRALVSISTVVETAWMLVVGWRVHKTGNLAAFLLLCPLLLLGGLVMVFLAGELHYKLGVMIAGQVVAAIGQASFEAIKEVVLLASARPDDMVMLLAMLSLSEKIGGMIGATLSDIAWAKALPDAPKKYMSAESILSAERVHPQLEVHLSYPEGSPERLDIQQVYIKTQRILLCVAMGGIVVGFFSNSSIRNGFLFRPPLSDDQKGPLFPTLLQDRPLLDPSVGTEIRESIALLDGMVKRYAEICGALRRRLAEMAGATEGFLAARDLISDIDRIEKLTKEMAEWIDELRPVFILCLSEVEVGDDARPLWEGVMRGVAGIPPGAASAAV